MKNIVSNLHKAEAWQIIKPMVIYCFPPLKKFNNYIMMIFFRLYINRCYYLYWCRIVYVRKSCSLKLCFLASFKRNLSNEKIFVRLKKSCHLKENCTNFLKQLCLKLLTAIKSRQSAKKLIFPIFWSLNWVWMQIIWLRLKLLVWKITFRILNVVIFNLSIIKNCFNLL